MNFDISIFTSLSSALGVTPGADKDVSAEDLTEDTATKLAPPDNFDKADKTVEQKISAQSAPKQEKNEVFGDMFAQAPGEAPTVEDKAATETKEPESEIDEADLNGFIDSKLTDETAKSLGVKKEELKPLLRTLIDKFTSGPELKNFLEENNSDAIKAARAKNEHYVGETEIDGVSKDMLKLASDMGGIDIGKIDDLEAGKTLEDQAAKLNPDQIKNLKEMADNLKDNGKIGPYLEKLRADHQRNFNNELAKRVQALEQAKQGNNPDPAVIKSLEDENNRFIQKLMNEMTRLKIWEEHQKFKNASMAANLAAIHDSIKLAASVQ